MPHAAPRSSALAPLPAPSRRNPAPLAFALVAAGRALDAAMERAASGDHGLTVAQARFMRHLVAAPEGLTPAELATAARTSRASVTQMVERLVEAGLLDRSPHASDARSVVVSLTTAGRTAYHSVEVALMGFEEDLRQSLGSSAPELWMAASAHHC